MKDRVTYSSGMHRFYEIGLDSRLGCRCPLRPKCLGVASMSWKLLQQARDYLLNDAVAWNLSAEHRRSIKFKMLFRE
jgi:hypothetical protein